MKNQVAIVIAVVLGILAVIAVNAHLSNVANEGKEGSQPVSVVAAKRDIEKGERLTPNGVEEVKTTIKAVRGGNYMIWTERDMYLNMYTLQEKVLKGHWITKQMLLRKATQSIGEELPQGQRAITIAVDQVAGNAGYISPGDHVDVFATFTVPGTGKSGERRADMKTYLLLSNVKVLRTGAKTSQTRGSSRFGMRETPYTTITFRVPQQAAHVLAFSQSTGRLTLALRPPGDAGLPKRKMLDMTDLIKMLETSP